MAKNSSKAEFITDATAAAAQALGDDAFQGMILSNVNHEKSSVVSKALNEQ